MGSMNGLMPKIALEANIHMDEQKVFHYLLTTIETPCKLHIFFPYLFQNILGMTQGHIEITHEHVVLEKKQVISILCNLTTKKIITTHTHTHTQTHTHTHTHTQTDIHTHTHTHTHTDTHTHTERYTHTHREIHTHT